MNKTERNQSMECCKLLAAVFVIFAHVPFPGTFGAVMLCIARFAVPVFFAISGYFSFRVDSQRISRRVARMGKLTLAATLGYLLWGLYITRYVEVGSRLAYLQGVFSARSLVHWLLFSSNPVCDPLWYLSAITFCYGVLWVYVRFFRDTQVNYRPLYGAGACLLLAHFLLGEFAMAFGTVLPYQLYRNGLLMGLPMFLLGMFLREYGQTLAAAFSLTGKKLWAVILAGMGLSLLEWKAIGSCELFVGTVATVAALLLFLSENPRLPARWKTLQSWSAAFGGISAWMYLLHITFFYIYNLFLRSYLVPVLGGKEEYFRTVFVVAASLLAAVLCTWLSNAVKRSRKHRKGANAL